MCLEHILHKREYAPYKSRDYYDDDNIHPKYQQQQQHTHTQTRANKRTSKIVHTLITIHVR